jgi:hypothetical protein
VAESLELHLHLPPGLTGVVHVYVGSTGEANSRHAGEPTSKPATALQAAESPAAEAQVDAMLARFERHDPASAARAVYRALVEQGWMPQLPQPRGGKPASAAAYVRLVYAGRRRKVSLYLNSAVLTSAGRSERDFVSGLPGAQVRNDDVYLPLDAGRADRAVENAEALRDWADGQTPGEQVSG